MNQDNKTISRNVRLKKHVVEKIELLAEKENRSFNNMVETELIKYIKQNP